MKKEKIKKPSGLVKVESNRLISVVLPFLVVFGMTLTVFLTGSKLIKSNKNKAIAESLITSTSISKDKIKESLEIINGLYIDPMTLTKIIDSNTSEVLIIDTRSSKDFERSHIRNSKNMSKDEILKEYKSLRNRKVIVYGENSYDPTPKDIAVFLLGKRTDVRVLAVGWNEFRHFRNLWVPEGLWNKIDIDKYISE